MNCRRSPESDGTDAKTLLARVRSGNRDELGRLFERYRNYIKLVAAMSLPQMLQGKVDASDVAQETFVQAHNGIDEFKGTTEHEFREWIQTILANEIAAQSRRYFGAQKRDVRMEVRLRESIDLSSSRLNEAIASPDTSPSQLASQRENGVRLADALSDLSEEQREIVVLHRLKELSFQKIATHLDIPVSRAYQIWISAVRRLQQILENE